LFTVAEHAQDVVLDLVEPDVRVLCAHLMVEKNASFESHVCIKTIILPRQARDKHSENSKKRCGFRERNAVGTEAIESSLSSLPTTSLSREKPCSIVDLSSENSKFSLRCGIKTVGLEPKRPEI
jgi:hypothetical protein